MPALMGKHFFFEGRDHLEGYVQVYPGLRDFRLRHQWLSLARRANDILRQPLFVPFSEGGFPGSARGQGYFVRFPEKDGLAIAFSLVHF